MAPIRFGLAVLGLVTAIAASANRAGALLAFGSASVVLVLAALADPRRHLFQIPDDPPLPPAGAAEDGVARLAWSAVFPSTVGVAALLVATLPFEPMLAALMAGILAGLGVAALVSAVELWLEERASGRRLLLRRGTTVVFAVPREEGAA